MTVIQTPNNHMYEVNVIYKTYENYDETGNHLMDAFTQGWLYNMHVSNQVPIEKIM